MTPAELATRLLDKAREGRRPLGLLIGVYSVDTLELACHFGFDWILVDQEHSQIAGPEKITNLVRMSEKHQIPLFVKTNARDPILARDALDAGAWGVQVPFVDTVEQLREMVAAIRFRPVGTRGFCRVARSTGYAPSGEGFQRYLDFQQNHALMIPTIETAEAVENLDAMLAAAPDCPIFAVGPDDLRMSLDIPFDDPDGDKEMLNILLAVCRKIHAAGKLNCMPMWGPDPKNSRDALAEQLSVFHNDMPYTADLICLNYAFREAIAIRDHAGEYEVRKRREAQPGNDAASTAAKRSSAV